MNKKIVKAVTPPVLLDLAKKIFLKKSVPRWNTVLKGVLEGRELYFDSALHKEFLDGTYDSFFWDYLGGLDLTGKTIFEIGGHIGYHALSFAELVGAKGKVYAFEPNPFNKERFMLNVSKNDDLAERIRLFDVAVSNNNVDTEFTFSASVDDGKSSGSFLKGAHTPHQANFYDQVGFTKTVVRALRMDDFENHLGVESNPYLIKIDVEGAENLVLNGGAGVIKKHRPIVLMEIHSIYNMLMTYEYFNDIGYSVNLLKEEIDGRCFISATPR
jgi:FkbM family methyltransferase